jgi:hypothetical protein
MNDGIEPEIGSYITSFSKKVALSPLGYFEFGAVVHDHIARLRSRRF